MQKAKIMGNFNFISTPSGPQEAALKSEDKIRGHNLAKGFSQALSSSSDQIREEKKYRTY